MTTFVGDRRRLSRILLAAIGATALCMAAYAYVRLWHPTRAHFPIQGLDVSHHQGTIDWQRVRKAGADFAYIKASEDGDHRDSRFTQNWQGARAAGLRTGAYHFFTLCRSGAEQAANFAATVPAASDTLPPAIDLEFGGNCAARPSRAAFFRELAIALHGIEAHSGKRAILYVTDEFDAAYRVSAAIPRPLWLRSLFAPPGYGARDWTIWQASNIHHVDGIEGWVDWNVTRQ
ncbi:GH25 family lysozyme [Flavisphingomonas formosensis]|uniref:GH25 family lysozyme n=1 Tax=Flavisphingomonas formosensis TaxID=861534 RepID=UPI0012F9051F|nr:GH25 family lysozyme [Sphingomonas formosensis]